MYFGFFSQLDDLCAFVCVRAKMTLWMFLNFTFAFPEWVTDLCAWIKTTERLKCWHFKLFLICSVLFLRLLDFKGESYTRVLILRSPIISAFETCNYHQMYESASYPLWKITNATSNKNLCIHHKVASFTEKQLILRRTNSSALFNPELELNPLGPTLFPRPFLRRSGWRKRCLGQ